MAVSNIAVMLVILLCGLVMSSLDADIICNKYSGPAGLSKCDRDSDFEDEFQKHTCVTKSYMEQRGLSCKSSQDSYCWIDCMADMFSRSSGSIESSCRCKAGDVLPAADLPEHCYSPDGGDCEWYNRCVEKKFPCSNDVDSYATGYGLKFCKLYNERRNYFSVRGKKWINDVRKCTQVKLVPFIHDYESISCVDIKYAGYNSHGTCYLENGMCQLTCFDWIQVFWTIKSSLLEEVWETIEELVTVYQQCMTKDEPSHTLKFCLSDAPSAAMKFIKIGFNAISSVIGKRALTDCDEECVARQVAHQVGTQMKWGGSNTGIDYIAFGNTTSEGLTVSMYMTDWRILNRTVSSNANFLNEIAKDVINRFEKGTLSVSLDGFQLDSVSYCADAFCRGKYMDIDLAADSGVKSIWGKGSIATLLSALICSKLLLML